MERYTEADLTAARQARDDLRSAWLTAPSGAEKEQLRSRYERAAALYEVIVRALREERGGPSM